MLTIGNESGQSVLATGDTMRISCNGRGCSLNCSDAARCFLGINTTRIPACTSDTFSARTSSRHPPHYACKLRWDYQRNLGGWGDFFLLFFSFFFLGGEGGGFFPVFVSSVVLRSSMSRGFMRDFYSNLVKYNNMETITTIKVKL